jgi:type I restriction enzyme M protein
MLDTDTKRRIDTARDILVGKVPDPKSQVEQITIALIYKFMDDMDAESEELGGKRKFFAKEFACYGWAKLLRAGLGGHEMLALYADGIAKMPENPGIPPLFRSIFKNAYLPYRDPETLKSFLKIIDEFVYDHSERLGDAFEYLLSILGSQGDAGQFRTPRHIIDFMVEIVAPTKNATVLDPACGTAGFLISAWKHILRTNTDKLGHSFLTPDDRGRLAKNFCGYDISPDMVRLSLVNLYLHGFNAPQIYEYDTLTSEERWNDHFDVILANPPFMSPKGGIKPHKRFSVPCNRSEVLFVDYMLEHLTAHGRAGIIVPEGIIFQNGTAYQRLRSVLVKDALIGVISLPSGVFQPYSGVKTSILVLDKRIAKSRPQILFSSVQAIGVSLGIKRTVTEHNDLPHVIRDFAAYYLDKPISKYSWLAERSAVLANDCNLSGERYRPIEVRAGTRAVRLAEVCSLKKGTHSSTKTEPGPYPLIVTAKNWLTSSDYQMEGETVCVPLISSTGHGRASINRIHFANGKFAVANLLAALQPKDPGVLNAKYLYLVLDLLKAKMAALMKGAANVSMKVEDLAEFKIPLPPLEVQREIVAEIEGYQSVINGARAVLDHYRPHIPIHPDWPMVTLDEIIESKPKNGYSGKPVDRVTKLKVLTLSATTRGKLDLSKFKYLDEEISLDAPCRCRRDDIYLQRGNTKELVGTAAIFDVDEKNFIYPDLMIRVRANKKKILSQYLLTALQGATVREYVTRNAVGAAGSMPKINQTIVESIPIPLPSIATQQAIVAEIEAEQTLVAANRELIARFEKKIQATLARVWGAAAPTAAERS